MTKHERKIIVNKFHGIIDIVLTSKLARSYMSKMHCEKALI